MDETYEKYPFYHEAVEDRKKRQIAQLTEIEKTGASFKTVHNLERSLGVLLSYVQDVSKQDFIATTHDPKLEYKSEAIESFVVSPSILRSYSCLDYGCSKCCWHHGFTNIFTGNQYKKYQDEYRDSPFYVEYNPFDVDINGNTFTFYKYTHDKEVCRHLNKEVNGCGIHIINPIHCAFPLLKLKRRGNKVSATKEYFGRNVTTIQCPVRFGKDDAKKGHDVAIYMYTRLKEMADELKINHCIDEILLEITRQYHILISETESSLW